MSAATFNQLNTVLKSRTPEDGALKAALDAHLGTEKLSVSDLSKLAFELGTRRHAKGGVLLNDAGALVDGIQKKSPALAAALHSRMQ